MDGATGARQCSTQFAIAISTAPRACTTSDLSDCPEHYPPQPGTRLCVWQKGHATIVVFGGTPKCLWHEWHAIFAGACWRALTGCATTGTGWATACGRGDTIG